MLQRGLNAPRTVIAAWCTTEHAVDRVEGFWIGLNLDSALEGRIDLRGGSAVPYPLLYPEVFSVGPSNRGLVAPACLLVLRVAERLDGQALTVLRF